jgi:hypothetical protein
VELGYRVVVFGVIAWIVVRMLDGVWGRCIMIFGRGVVSGVLIIFSAQLSFPAYGEEWRLKRGHDLKERTCRLGQTIWYSK